MIPKHYRMKDRIRNTPLATEKGKPMNQENLDTFTLAYLECALWAENNQSTPQGGEPFGNNYSIEDFTPEALREAVEDCRRFQEENSGLLEKTGYDNPEYSDDEMAGHDFWLTRNGHVAGFWDGDLEKKLGDQLTVAATAFGECHIYVGDDGRLYLH